MSTDRLAEIAAEFRALLARTERDKVAMRELFIAARKECRSRGISFDRWVKAGHLGRGKTQVYAIIGPDEIYGARRETSGQANVSQFFNAKHYWLVPDWLFALLDRVYEFDFDPCPCPRPEGFDGLIVPWGRSNWVNIPFIAGVMKWVRKAIAEAALGKTVVMILPGYQSRVIRELETAGAETLAIGSVPFMAVDDGTPQPDPVPCMLAVLGAALEPEIIFSLGIDTGMGLPYRLGNG